MVRNLMCWSKYFFLFHINLCDTILNMSTFIFYTQHKGDFGDYTMIIEKMILYYDCQ